MKKINLKFATLLYKEGDRYLSEVKKELIKAFNYNKKFFEIKIPHFSVTLVYSRKEFDKIWGGKTEDFVSGFSRDNEIVIFSYFVFNKETKWRKKDFYPCLVHEINHLFYEELRDDSYDPLWLSEGLATFIQCRRKRLKHKKRLKITKEILLQGFNEMDVDSYHIHYLFVKYLIDTFGKDKLFKYIKGLRKGKKSDILFKQIYKKSLGELIEDANRHQKTIRSS